MLRTDTTRHDNHAGTLLIITKKGEPWWISLKVKGKDKRMWMDPTKPPVETE